MKYKPLSKKSIARCIAHMHTLVHTVGHKKLLTIIFIVVSLCNTFQLTLQLAQLFHHCSLLGYAKDLEKNK